MSIETGPISPESYTSLHQTSKFQSQAYPTRTKVCGSLPLLDSKGSPRARFVGHRCPSNPRDRDNVSSAIHAHSSRSPTSQSRCLNSNTSICDCISTTIFRARERRMYPDTRKTMVSVKLAREHQDAWFKVIESL